MSNLSDKDVEQISEKITQNLTEHKRAQWVDSETHFQHHEWISQKRNDEQDLRKMRLKVIEGVIISAAIATSGYFLLSLLKASKAAIKAVIG